MVRIGNKTHCVFLADDSEDDLLVMREAIDQEPLIEILAVARDGEEAWTYLKRLANSGDMPRPDIIILDINMPKMNGLEVLEAIRNDSCLSHLPVVILTTSEREEDIVQSYKKGASSFITKPVDSYRHAPGAFLSPAPRVG